MGRRLRSHETQITKSAMNSQKLQSSVFRRATVAAERSPIGIDFLVMGRPEAPSFGSRNQEGSPMIRKVTFALLAATAAVSFASPSFAQSQDRYGSPQPY